MIVHHPAEESLHRLVDGELPAAELVTLERHLAGCERCRAAVERLERLRRLVASAPRDVAPPPELWTALRERLPQVAREGAASPDVAPVVPSARAGRRGLWSTAAALVVLAGAAALAARGWGGGTAPPPVAPSAPAPMVAAADADPLIAELRAELQARRRVITPETMVAVEENLRAIDAAITATRAALAADPDNVHLESMLERARRQQAEYVQGTLSLASGL